MKISRIAILLSFVVLSSFATVEAQLTSHMREVFVRTNARDALLEEEDVNGMDIIFTLLDGLFVETAVIDSTTMTGTTNASSQQTSWIEGSAFMAMAEVATDSIEDGTSSNVACASFELFFELAAGGNVDFVQLDLLAERAELEGQVRSDITDVFVSIIEETTNLQVFEEGIAITHDDEGYRLSAPQQVDLAPGSYRMEVIAEIRDSNSAKMSPGQPRGSNAQFIIEGSITAEVLGDINGDSQVNLFDIAPFVDLISTGTYSPSADMNLDNQVNLLDVAHFVQAITG